MVRTTLSSKGQLVIPLDLRRKLGLQAGDQLACDVEGNRLVLIPNKRESATLKMAEDGLPVLSAPKTAPRMTPELVKDLLLED